MEDSLYTKIRYEDFSQSNFTETPQLSLTESNTDFFSGGKSRSKHISFASPKHLNQIQSFATSHTRSGSYQLSPAMKNTSSFQDFHIKPSLQKLDEEFVKITEDLNSDRNTVRETGFETVREKNADLYKDLRGSIATDRSTFARQTLDDMDLRDIPSLRWCAFCKKESCIEIEYRNSSKTFFASLGIFLMGGVCGCFLLPYASDGCKDHKYLCHTCKHEVPLVTGDN